MRGAAYSSIEGRPLQPSSAAIVAGRGFGSEPNGPFPASEGDTSAVPWLYLRVKLLVSSDMGGWITTVMIWVGGSPQ